MSQATHQRGSTLDCEGFNPFGYGSKLNHPGTAGFSPCFHFPGLHFGYLFLTHSHFAAVRNFRAAGDTLAV